MRVTIMCLSHFVCLLLLLIKRNDIIFNFCNFVWCSSKCTASSPDLLKDSHNFLTLRQATFLMTCLWTRHAILRHQDWPFSWRFYLFDQVTSFLLGDTQKFRWFYDLNRICSFYWVDIMHFCGYPRRKWIVPIDTAAFLGQKQQNSEHCQKST